MASGDNIKKINIQNYKLLPLFIFISHERQKVADRPYALHDAILNYIYQEDAEKNKIALLDLDKNESCKIVIMPNITLKISKDNEVIYGYKKVNNNTFIKTIAIYIDTKNSNRIIATNNIDIIEKMLTAHPLSKSRDEEDNKLKNDQFNNTNGKQDATKEPQLEGYEPKTNNGCSCNLDCLGCFKRIFGG